MKFQDIETNGLGKSFLKLKDKDKVTGVFRGEPLVLFQHWIENKSVRCASPKFCESCDAGDRPNFRFHINFVTKEDGGFVAKIFAGGKRIYSQLKSLNEEFDLEDTIVSVSRQGSGKDDTTYTVLPIKNHSLSADKAKLEAVEAVALLDLDPMGPQPLAESRAEDDGVPF